MPRKRRASAAIFEARPIPVPFIVGIIILHIIFILVVNLIYFERGYGLPILKLTHGWINETLSGSLIGVITEVFIFLLMIVKVSPRELGLRKDKFLPGLLGFLLFWFLIHIVNLGITLFTDSNIIFNTQIKMYPSYIAGNLLAQLFGNALLEEIVFRGFLFVQLFLLCKRIKAPSLRVFSSMLGSQIIFALIHIPNRIYSGSFGVEFVSDFFRLVIMGIMFCLLYWLTKNLFFVIGVHSLLNAQVVLWNNDFSEISTLGCFVLLTLLLPLILRIGRLLRKPAARGLAQESL